jgi:hypothetical protein
LRGLKSLEVFLSLYISIKGDKKTKAPQLRGLKSLEVFLSLYISIKGDKKTKAPQLRGFSIIKVCFLNQKTILLCFRLI